MQEVEIEEVKGFAQQARFFREGNKDYVEISFIGNPDTVIQRVTPQVMAQYRDAWNAYCDGVPMQQRKGTALTELKEISAEKAADLVRRNVHTLEELAALSDHQCQGLGHGTMTLRRTAQGLLATRQFQQKEEAHKKITDSVVPVAQHHPEMQALEEIVKAQGEQISQIGSAIERLATLLADVGEKKAPVRKKRRNGPTVHTGDNEPSV